MAGFCQIWKNPYGVGMRKSIMLPLLCLAAFMVVGFVPTPDVKMDNAKAGMGEELVPPASAFISPNGARLEVRQQVPVRHANGKSIVTFILPPGASNLELNVPGHVVSRWSTTPVLLDADRQGAGRRVKIEKEKVEINAQLMTVNSRIALWQAPPKSASTEEMNRLQAAMAAEMPRLVLEQAELQRRLKLVDEELARMPQISGLGERVRVVLADAAPEGQNVEILYAYYHDSCGWEAIYDFNAKPDEGSGDVIDVRLLAEVWQFTGMDWKDTQITLSTRGYGPREPQPLPEWIVDSQQKRLQPRAAMLGARAAVPMAANAISAAGEMAPVDVNTESVYASWKLSETGLPQGRSRLQITSAAWKAPLQWLARPSRDSSQVWLFATYQLPPDQAWPAGQAQYNVSGQNVGMGMFQPRSGEASLYFGADPRVTVQTTTDTQKRGESGFINTSKSWTWAWTYTITNQHNKEIKVKVERPVPVIVDEDVTVSYKNTPQAVIDNKKHMLYWEVEVPANGKTAIEHSITISSPTKLPLLPDVP